MLKQNRLNFIKKLGIRSQSRITSQVPSMIDTSELEVLWSSFLKSRSFKFLSSKLPSDAVDYNFCAALAWLSFLENHHIPTKQDIKAVYRSDIVSELEQHITKVLTNLRLYKVVPAMRLDTASTQVILPKPDTELSKLNILYGPKIKVLLNYVPKKKNMIDLKKLQGPKLVKSSVDAVLSQMHGYLFRDRGEFLSYNKPMTPRELMTLSEYQWMTKEGIQFRHNGDSLAVLYSFDYSGVVPISDSRELLTNFHTITSNALRKIK